MATKLRHTQRVKQKLEDKLDNLKTLEDKLHSTIRNHVAKAEMKCQQMLNIDNTSEFMSQYGRVAQILEAASNTIDLLTISAEELIENAGFDDIPDDEMLSWSADNSILCSTVCQPDSTLHDSKVCEESTVKVDTSHGKGAESKKIQSKSTVPVTGVRHNSGTETTGSHIDSPSCNCDKNTQTLPECKDCMFTGKETSETKSPSAVSISEQTLKDVVPETGAKNKDGDDEICDTETVTSITDSKTIVDQSDTDNKSIKSDATSQNSPSQILPRLPVSVKNLGQLDTGESGAKKTKLYEADLLQKSGSVNENQKVTASTPTKKKKSKRKGGKGSASPTKSVCSVSSDNIQVCDSKNKDKLNADQLALKQAEAKYNEFEAELCREINRQSLSDTSKPSAVKVKTDKQNVNSKTIEISTPTPSHQTSSRSKSNVKNDTHLKESSNQLDSSDINVNDSNSTAESAVKSELHTTLDSSAGETSEKSSTSTKGLAAGSLLSGKITPVIVSEIVSPWCFFVQKNGTQLTQLMEHICEYMGRSGLKESPLTNPNIGTICLARYNADATYYRAYVTQVYKSSDCRVSEVDVLYVDYGNRERVKIKDLRAIPHKFMTLPSQAICCALAGVMPCNKYCVWAEDDVNLFRQYVTGQNLTCVTSSIRSSATNIPQIVQLSVTYPIPSMKTLPGGPYYMSQFSIGELLIQAKRARQVELPEQVGLLVKSGEGAEEVAILGCSVETDSDSSVQITEIFDCKTTPMKQRQTNAPSTQSGGDNKTLTQQQVVKSDPITCDGKTLEQKPAKQEGSVIQTENKLKGESMQCEVKKPVDSSVGSVEVKPESKSNNMNGDSLQSENSETESHDASRVHDRVHDKEVSVVGSRGQLDKIKEEVQETGLCETRSTGTSVSNISDLVLDQESSLADVHYDFNYIQFNPQGQEVMLSHVKTPKEFYVHIISQQCGEALDSLMKNLNSIFEKANRRKLARMSKSFEPAVNKLCCAQFQQDNSFYRGVIRGIKPDKHMQDGYVLVHYIDFGDEEWLSRKRIFPLPSHFCTVPRLALKCKLVYIKPAVNKEQGSEPVKWSKESIKKFMEIAGCDCEKTLHMHVVHGNLEDLKHCDPSDNVPSLGVLLVDYTGPEEVCINFDMINEGVAVLAPAPTKGKVDQQPSQDNSKSVETMDTWNPMEDDFFSKRNSYNIDTDDVGVATTGYKADNAESNVCRFFSAGKSCWQGERCPFRHVRVDSGVTMDRDEVYAITDEPTDHLPMVGSWVAMEITTILSPCHFYAILPLGNKSLDKSMSKSEPSECGGCMGVTGSEETLDDLLAALSQEYNKRPSHQQDMFMKAIGQMVVARYSKDQQWYRGKVVGVSEEKVKIFFVDFGNTEWLPEDELADIKPEFLHLPFQAIECFLDIECSGTDQWSKQSKQEFYQLVDGKTLVGHVKSRSWNGRIWLELYDTTSDIDINVGEVMVEKGYAKIVNVSSEVSVETRDNSVNSHSVEEVLIPG